ncbi:hypothetical protein FHX82_000314 [Amycolatopsis bartoniae]|uniref:MFS transporter n=1 Tax=Amycolatopsis bartoniae TaxID=941986 RepID=A0A8H9ITL8_9PSEU|nr:hypothetical protein [Amycolatopsis bartoniae]MBB2933294.1 hypothetical protein [Amycolatopsis bartoniae]TVT08096.1 hypothetical protein FNH07_14070 [Amycolatopsis bartoniae]GHF58470.1 hypothetical protein GCM10017566_34780 [Amycolatopsis bartoniae]
MNRRPRSHGASRAVRGALLALCSAGLGITAHALADGGLPDTALTLLLTALVGWTGAALAERTRGPLGVFAVLGTAQLAMHLVLTELMGHAAPAAGMFLAHGVATALTAGLLWHAEAMIRVAVARLWLLLPVVWRPAPVAAAPAPVLPSTDPATSLVSVLLRRVHGRRGPPAFS